jgi:hypothetical protein
MMVFWESFDCLCFFHTQHDSPNATPSCNEVTDFFKHPFFQFFAYIIVQEEMGNNPGLVCVPQGVKNVYVS